jgi:DNA polymerase-3 subunit delta
MAAWDLRRLQQFLEKHPPGNLYLVYGEETYLINEAQKLIQETVLGDGVVDFNLDRLYTSEASPSQVRDIVETLPVMCERRCVIYKGVQTLKEKDWQQLMPILENPIDSCTLILIAEKVDKRKKFFKKISDEGTVVELKRPYDNQIPSWIDYIAFQNGVELDGDGIRLVHQMVGGNLTEVNNEMQKLKQYLGERRRATNEDLLHVVSQVRVDSIFDLTNAIGRKDQAAALTYLANLLEHGESEVAALSLVLRHVRILATLKEGIKQGLSSPKLSAKAGVSNFFLNQYVNQAKLWTEDKIADTIETLHETDRAIKSSPVSSHIWLENFILQTCR